MLWYVPLESLKERYTMQWSAPETGWLERNWRKQGIEYRRINGEQNETPKTIKTGCVLDAVARSQFSFSQISQLLNLAEAGEIKSTDRIFFDDFWTPGMEALPYAFSMFNIKPKMFAFLHAQSCDVFDFMYPMRSWVRDFERGVGNILTGIFVCCPGLKEEVVLGGITPAEKVHVTGHPFCSEEVMERMPQWYKDYIATGTWKHVSQDLNTGKLNHDREDKVVYASRWDSEKDPLFFLEVAKEVIKHRPNVKFVVCSSAPKLRSNDPGLLDSLYKACGQSPNNIFLKEGLTKEEYYAELTSAKVNISSALQDWNPISGHEASVAGCWFVYPYFRSFPNFFGHQHQFMYCHQDLDDAVAKTIKAIDARDLWTVEKIKERSWIHKRFDESWRRMLDIMYMKEYSLVIDPYIETEEARKYWSEQ